MKVTTSVLWDLLSLPIEVLNDSKKWPLMVF